MPYTVVSIEDNIEISELLRVVLEHPEIEVHCADNGVEGLALIRQVRPDLVLLDVVMPGEMAGWEVYDAVRADADLKQTPIMMLSVARERRRPFAGSEIDEYVTKPFDALHLRRMVSRLLGREGHLWSPPGR